MNNLQYDEIKTEWVFFDCFDTIFKRTFSPDYIKKIWSKRISVYLDFCLCGKELYEIRRSAERYLIGTKSDQTEGEFDCFELYHEMLNRIEAKLFLKGIVKSFNTEDITAAFYQCEIETEKQYLELNDDVAQCVKQLSKTKQLAIVSDYHMPEHTIREFLKFYQLEGYFHSIFVSCQMACNKHSGNIYKTVLEKLQLQPDQVTMIGDTPDADVKNARKLGLEAILYEKKKSWQQLSLSDFEKKLKKNNGASSLGILSYSNYYLVFYLMIERIYHKIQSLDIHKVYFLAREGELLKKLFDLYCSENQINCKSEYLYVSRQSTYLATLDEIETENFGVLSRNNKDMNIDSFLKSLGFHSDEITAINHELNLDFNDKIVSFFGSKEFKALCENDYFVSLYNQKRQSAKALFSEYLAQHGMDDEEKTVIIDVGWNGTMQDNLFRFFDSKKQFIGMYCGVTAKAKSTPQNRKLGILFTNHPAKSPDYDIWSFDHTFFERILTASHPTTIGYQKVGDKVEPVLSGYDYEKDNYERIKPIQELLIQKFRNCIQLFSNSAFQAEDLYDFILKTHVKTMLDMGIKKIKFQQTIYENQLQNFGNYGSVSDINKNIFGFKQILKKLWKRLYLFKNSEILIKILAQNKLYFLIPPVCFFKKRQLLKEIRKNSAE